VFGGLVALAANFLSPRGLSLTRDYFPVRFQADARVTTTGESADLTEEHLTAQGLPLADHQLVARLFHDPRRDQELIVFVDARDEQHYMAGHIPGAYPFDRYRLENYLPSLLPVCQTAETIVIYCTGGSCEDSGFAALTLRDAGVGNAKLFVYSGGITEWQNTGLPLETGTRNSGTLRD
jgi:rhodanese-related sulfurtransferase